MNDAHFRGEIENLSSTAPVLPKTSNLVISRCCFADDGKEIDKNEKIHVQSVQIFCFFSLNMQICDVLVAVAVVVAKAPENVQKYTQLHARLDVLYAVLIVLLSVLSERLFSSTSLLS